MECLGCEAKLSRIIASIARADYIVIIAAEEARKEQNYALAKPHRMLSHGLAGASS
jgi:hypothetical protein